MRDRWEKDRILEPLPIPLGKLCVSYPIESLLIEYSVPRQTTDLQNDLIGINDGTRTFAMHIFVKDRH